MKEEWRPIVDFVAHYMVSDLGRVKSLDRRIERNSRWGGKDCYLKKGRIMRQSMRWCNSRKTHGYFMVVLKKEGKQWAKSVHRLQMEAFLGPANGRYVNHIDFDCRNNNLKNLEWVTQKQNIQHSAKAGRMHLGELHGISKLTDKKVLSMRAEYRRGANGFGFQALANKYGVSYVTARNAIIKTTWRHI